MIHDSDSKATEKPYYVLDGGKIRCEKCGKLANWADAAETETGYMCPGCAGIEVD